MEQEKEENFLKKPFEIGETVVVYDGIRHVAEITGMDEKRRLFFSTPALHGNPYHQKQCRRLIKKKRRQIWIKQVFGVIKLEPGFNSKSQGNLSSENYVSFQEQKEDGWIRFIEAKENK